VKRCARQAGKKIETQELDMPEAVFNTPAENEEEKHVSQKVQPAPVQEHGNEGGDKKAPKRQVGESVACDVPGWNDSKEENQPVDVPAIRKFNEEDPYVRDNDCEGNEPEAPAPDVVGEGDGHHKGAILHGEALTSYGKSMTKGTGLCQNGRRAARTARQAKFQKFNFASPRPVSLVENKDVTRSGKANLAYGVDPIRTGCVNDCITVELVTPVFEFAFCCEDHLLAPREFHSCPGRVVLPLNSVLTCRKRRPVNNGIVGKRYSS
jgi:hypothetical protein